MFSSKGNHYRSVGEQSALLLSGEAIRICTLTWQCCLLGLAMIPAANQAHRRGDQNMRRFLRYLSRGQLVDEFCPRAFLYFVGGLFQPVCAFFFAIIELRRAGQRRMPDDAHSLVRRLPRKFCRAEGMPFFICSEARYVRKRVSASAVCTTLGCAYFSP